MNALTEKQKMLQRQSLPLEAKIEMTKKRVREWYDHWDGDVYLSLSFGKDSFVLYDIIKSMNIEIPSVFSNTGLEMPEIVKFGREIIKNDPSIEEIRPKKHFKEVWEKEGIPLVSKKVARMVRTLQGGSEGRENTYRLYDTGINSQGVFCKNWKLPNKWRSLVSSEIKMSEKCCDYLKKEPIKTYQKRSGRQGITAMMADEGGYRGGMTTCNQYTAKNPMSSPMLFWTEADIWEYVDTKNLEICHVYYERIYDSEGELIWCATPHWKGEPEPTGYRVVFQGDDYQILELGDELHYRISGEPRTGCMFCAFGVHLDKGLNRFQRMKISHPRQHRVITERMDLGSALQLIDVKFIPEGVGDNTLFENNQMDLLGDK
ncbi:phosphoadenosine phosphosulfate reductase [Vibrio crassostreae 9CS106]|uniref:Phosphoadenosine phosphosulfate reductase n=1 Tax=Vibrio crassostreae 9CS106 TaxID=1191300 RepID=A0A1B1C3D0_9VIBR|nr:phosphoadenosine phosphosulfate reductase [Vibrio crassostreae 9CS106]